MGGKLHSVKITKSPSTHPEPSRHAPADDSIRSTKTLMLRDVAGLSILQLQYLQSTST